MARTPAHKLSPERKIKPLLSALENHYGRPRRPKRDPLEVLIGGVLSQNTSDTNSARAYESLMRTFGSWQGIAAASKAAIERAIRSGGLAAQKAGTIKTIMRRLSARGSYSLDFLRSRRPREAEAELKAIKGVGVKTARLVLLFGFGKPVFVVDTHVHRVARRLGLTPERTSREKAHLLLDDLVPDARKYSTHMNMIRHGRQVCRALRPLCSGCPLRRWCLFVRKSS